MAIAEIEELLKRTTGLDAALIGRTALEHAARQRLAACGLVDLEEYAHHLSHSATELLELIEAVVVLETWFFATPNRSPHWVNWSRNHGWPQMPGRCAC